VLVTVNNLGVARASSMRASSATPAAASSTAAGPPSSPAASPATIAPLDVTAESLPDTEALADAVARRAELMVVKQNEADEESQLRIDRMRAEFDNAQAERAELMREMNVLRDMALDQQKRDDEILKKWIALI
jgi:hypothetical protein